MLPYQTGFEDLNFFWIHFQYFTFVVLEKSIEFELRMGISAGLSDGGDLISLPLQNVYVSI